MSAKHPKPPVGEHRYVKYSKPPVGEHRYVAPQVSSGGTMLVTRVVGQRVYVRALDDASGNESWYRRDYWTTLPYASPEPSPARMDDWVGRQVILGSAITTGVAHYPAGTRCRVVGHHQGKLSLALVNGPESISIRRVERHRVYLVSHVAALGREAKIKEGWACAGRLCRVLSGPFLCGGQHWVTVKWFDEEDPDCFKLVGLEPANPLER